MSDLIKRDEALKALCYFCNGRCKAENTNGKNGIKCSQWIALCSMMPAVETTAEWISVKDRLPETIPCNAGTAYSEAVCVLTEDRIVCTAVWNGEYWIGDFDYWESDGKVTHWKPVIPLPEPPKGDTE